MDAVDMHIDALFFWYLLSVVVVVIGSWVIGALNERSLISKTGSFKVKGKTYSVKLLEKATKVAKDDEEN